MRISFVILMFLSLFGQVHSQLKQTHRYELEKKNSDDFFTVLPAGEEGVIIFRDTDDYKKGDIWQLTSLDTALTERWQTDLALDSKYVFKGYDMANGKLHILFREGEYEKNDYHVISVGIVDGEVERFDIENEIPLQLSHIAMLDDRLVLGGYVNFRPTLVYYPFGSTGFEVIPGFFKDKSTIVDLRDNNNTTFNSVTIENDYSGNFLRVRTYSYDGEILFEREVKLKDNLKVLGAKTSGFIDGNFVLAGTYGLRKSYYAVGIYFVIVRPEGQDNLIKYFDFSELEHFFDYMPEKRARRIKEKLAKKVASGQQFHFPSRLILHDILKSTDGYLLSAELFDPEYETRNSGMPGFDYQSDMQRQRMATQNYAKQPSKLQNVDNADRFEYLSSIIFELNKQGQLIWDNSLKIENTELFSLEQVVHIAQNEHQFHMVYRTDKQVVQKTIAPDSAFMTKEPIRLTNPSDEIKHTYNGVGRSEKWYDNNFIIWGFHKVQNDVEVDDKTRSVLYVNKVVFE